MRSKIMIDLMDGEMPCLRIERGFDAGKNGDLPDKVLQSMFQKLIDGDGHASSFFGMVCPKDTDSTFLIPLTIGHALEWMHRKVVSSYAHDSDTGVRLKDAFETIWDAIRGPVETK